MKVLITHNRYRSAIPSGENMVVDSEIAALKVAGVQVISYIRSSDEIQDFNLMEKIAHAGSSIHSRESVGEVRRLIATERPDVLHLHNPYPLISMSIVRASATAGIPVVQTVHNHRHTCMKGTYRRDNHTCHDCVGKEIPWPGVLHGCYRGSRSQSAVMALALATHRSDFGLISGFIALTPEIRSSLEVAGVSPDRIHLKPNSVADPGPVSQGGTGFTFIGRLSEEKGVLLLLNAWRNHQVGSLGKLRIIGSGPAYKQVLALTRDRPDVHVLGRVEPASVVDFLRDSAVVVVPSVWPEALPLTVLEAMAAGRPVMVSDVGGLPRVVTSATGWVVQPNVEAWTSALAQAAATDPSSRGSAARSEYELKYHPSVVTKHLISIYEAVIAAHRLKRRL